LRTGHARWIDLLDVELQHADGARTRLWAASTVALGYVTAVVRFGRERLPRLGRQAYAAASLLTVPPRLQVQVLADGAPLASGTCTGVVINNTTHLANFRALPQARLDDGLLDLLLLDAGWARQLAHNLAVVCGSAAFGARVMQQATTVAVTSQTPLVVMVDGELLHDVVHLAVTCVPRGVRCVSAAPTAGVAA
jgi:diacylglycerol kinase family enzyme